MSDGPVRTTWTPALPEHGGRGQALQDAVIADVRAGRLRPGDPLPGTRTLARALGLARGTVVQAYADLEAEGWVHAIAGSGVRVREDLPVDKPPERVHSGSIGFDLPPRAFDVREPRPTGAALSLLGGQPDARLVPVQAFAQAYGRVLRNRGRRLLDYGDPGGEPRLRAALAEWLAQTRGVRPDPGGLYVTRGSQQALFLIAHALLRPGDRVGVERLGYRPAWASLQSAGAVLVPLDVDDDGAVVDQLPDDVRAVYLTPHHQYPTGATLSARRRLWLSRWAARNRAIIIEDDYDHEYHYEGTPVRPLVASDTAGVVVSVGTLSKAFAPGLRLGWIVGPPAAVDRLVELRTIVDRQGDRALEHAIAELIEDGTLGSHLRRTRRVYTARRAALREAVARDLPGLDVVPRPGGLALWAHAPGVDVDAWARAALDRGVLFEAASSFTLDGSRPPWVRLGFAAHHEGELREAVRRLRQALPGTGQATPISRSRLPRSW